MNFNKILLNKIEKLVSLSKIFDNIFKTVIELPDNIINEQNIDNVYSITTNYISTRQIHGELILLMNELYNSSAKISESDNNYLSKLYDISTFNSIMSNINDLINNIDLQYKKFALKYPKIINKNPLTIILLTDLSEEENKYTKLIDNLKLQFPENFYKIIKCNKDDKKIKCDKYLNINLTLKIISLPSLYIINGTNITEIPLNKINDFESISNILK